MKNKNKFQHIFQLFIGVAMVLLLNMLSSFLFYRFDLTAEKRYSLSPATKNLLKKLDDIVYFQIYLDGEFPAGFRRLRNETKELLDEMRIYAGDNVQYTFINPSEAGNPQKNNEVYAQLYKQGLLPTSLQIKTENGKQTSIIFPGALVTYRGKTVPLQLLKNQIGMPEEEVLNASVENLEYELSGCILKLTASKKHKIAFLTGHGETDTLHTKDIRAALAEYYPTDMLALNHQLYALRGYDAVVIAKPDSAFDEKDKFVIDQFIMNGGKVLWLLDQVMVSMDSLSKSNVTLGLARTLNLEDMLFRYGARINTNLVMDMQSAPIPVLAGYEGNKPQYRYYPWAYFPVTFPASNHPIIKNLNAIKFEFASGIDTVQSPGVNKTVLLTTSQFSKTVNTPARIDLGILKRKPQAAEFSRRFVPLAVLLEGNFESVFKHRMPPEITNNQEFPFKGTSKKTAMIVISDGDVISNQVQQSTGNIYPLGYDRYTGQQYGNKNFILNCMNYLLDDSGLITVRSRDIKIRLLDRLAIQQNKTSIQWMNAIIPVLTVIIFGILIVIIQRKRFA